RREWLDHGRDRAEAWRPLAADPARRRGTSWGGGPRARRLRGRATGLLRWRDRRVRRVRRGSRVPTGRAALSGGGGSHRLLRGSPGRWVLDGGAVVRRLRPAERDPVL